MTQAASGRWLLLIHQIPPKPDYLRVKVWRRLLRIGAVRVKNSVYALPYAEQALEDFQWLLREVAASGGEGSILRADFVDGLTDRAIEALFREARAADYAEILDAAKSLAGAPAAEVARLDRRLAEVTAIDYFGAPRRAAAERAVARLVTRVGEPGSPGDVETRAARRAARPRGRTWVTRHGVFVDRIASAWLIRRFIDRAARFKLVAPEGYAPRRGELRFDMFEAEYTHEADRCTFETLLRRFRLRDAALRAIGEVVHDIDFKEAAFGRAEATGIERLLAGIVRKHPADTSRLRRGAAVFDDLYESFRAASHRRPRRRPKR